MYVYMVNIKINPLSLLLVFQQRVLVFVWNFTQLL